MSMTLENFLQALSVNREHQIRILSHDDKVLYFFEGKELGFNKSAYFDPELKHFCYIGVTDLEKMVTNWTCWNNRIIIYIKENEK